MEGRSKVAAETAAVVPFHCVICFDEFCLKERLPVVLPCGHTFVCAPCSKRLKRCMECREPLFYTVPKRAGSHQTYTRDCRVNGRYSPTPSTPPQSHQPLPQATTQVMFPLPKNVVLISMMEAAARQARESTKRDDTNGSMNADEDEEYDLNRIIGGMATLSGPCGTYAVKEAVPLVSKDPAQGVRLNFSASEESIEPEYAEEKEPEIKNTLEKGQTVQVVNFVDGVAQLARGAGFVLARSSQLVKIGGPLETSCRLEGLLDTVVNRGTDLQKELDENERIETSLRREIEVQLQVEPSHPVITEAPKIEVVVSPTKSQDSAEPTTPKSLDEQLLTPHLNTPETSSPEYLILNGTNSLRVDENGLVAYGTRYGQQQRQAFPFSSNSIDNADIRNPGLPGYRRSNSVEDNDYIYGCGTASFLGSGVHLFTADPAQDNMLENQGHLRPTLENQDHHRSTRGRSNSSDALHPCLSPTPSSSFDTIDFRTGMSGHRGLSNANKNQGHSPTPRGRRLMMMSEHRGIGRVKGPLHRTMANNSAS